MDQPIDVIRKLGEGSFGEVFLVQRGEAKSEFALKVFKTGDHVNKDEVNILQQLCHCEHIVQYRDYIKYGEMDAVLMEYCVGGDLENYLKNQSEPLEESLVWEWFSQLSTAINYIHSQKVIHRDLKPTNVLLHNGQLKISDFGLATIIIDMTLTNVSTSEGRGTYLYMAPELFGKPAHFGKKSDIWGLGCIVYEMCTRKRAFPAIYNIIITNECETVEGNYSDRLKLAVKGMLQKSREYFMH